MFLRPSSPIFGMNEVGHTLASSVPPSSNLASKERKCWMHPDKEKEIW